MVERLSEEPRPVRLPHATYRLGDGDTVPCPQLPPHVLRWGRIAYVGAAVLFALVLVIGALR